MFQPSPDFLLGFAAGTICTALAMWNVIRRCWDRERVMFDARLQEQAAYQREIADRREQCATMTERCESLKRMVEGTAS